MESKNGSLTIQYVVPSKQTSHGLFDYDNTNGCSSNTLKIGSKTCVIIRSLDILKVFETFKAACEYKKAETKHKRQEEINKYSFFALVFRESDGIKTYSYNQVSSILDYFGDSMDLESINSNLSEVFDDCSSIQQAKSQLEYLGVENFSKDLWKVAKTLSWRKSSKLSKVNVNGVKLQEGDIVKMGRLKIKLKKISLFSDNNKSKKENHPVHHRTDTHNNYEDYAYVDHEKDVSLHEKSESNEEIPPCRFCLSNEMESDDNPLINPCACKGTQGLLHVD